MGCSLMAKAWKTLVHSFALLYANALGRGEDQDPREDGRPQQARREPGGFPEEEPEAPGDQRRR